MIKNMIDLATLEKLQNISIEERITIIEMLLGTLKNDISPKTESVSRAQRPAFGYMRGTGEILGDVVAPVLPKNM
jgi:hypothetical protein